MSFGKVRLMVKQAKLQVAGEKRALAISHRCGGAALPSRRSRLPSTRLVDPKQSSGVVRTDSAGPRGPIG